MVIGKEQKRNPGRSVRMYLGKSKRRRHEGAEKGDRKGTDEKIREGQNKETEKEKELRMKLEVLMNVWEHKPTKSHIFVPASLSELCTSVLKPIKTIQVNLSFFVNLSIMSSGIVYLVSQFT